MLFSYKNNWLIIVSINWEAGVIIIFFQNGVKLCDCHIMNFSYYFLNDFLMEFFICKYITS